MGSDLPKTLCIVAGKPMLAHILNSLTEAGNCLPPIVVVGHKGSQVREFLGSSIATVEQTDLSGTGTAARIALAAVPPDAKTVLIMYGDHPFIDPASIRSIEETHNASGAAITFGTTTVPDYGDWRRVFISFGRVIRNLAGDVQEIREYKNTNEHEQNIRELNIGFYCVDRAWLEEALGQIERDSVSGEYYLTDIVSLALYQGKHVETVPISPEEALGINSPEDAKLAESLHSDKK